MGIRVLVTGSRTWPDDGSVEKVLDSIIALNGVFTLVHGACPDGADAVADRWARRLGVVREPHPALWRVGGKYNPKAGYERNTYMASTQPDLCVAFFMPCTKNEHRNIQRHRSHGAAHCYSEALRFGVLVRFYEGEGL